MTSVKETNDFKFDTGAAFNYLRNNKKVCVSCVSKEESIDFVLFVEYEGSDDYYKTNKNSGWSYDTSRDSIYYYIDKVGHWQYFTKEPSNYKIITLQELKEMFSLFLKWNQLENDISYDVYDSNGRFRGKKYKMTEDVPYYKYDDNHWTKNSVNLIDFMSYRYLPTPIEPPTHTITIDGIETILSTESVKALKETLNKLDI